MTTGCLHIAMQHRSSITQLQEYIERGGNHGLVNEIPNVTLYYAHLDKFILVIIRILGGFIESDTTTSCNKNAMPDSLAFANLPCKG